VGSGEIRNGGEGVTSVASKGLTEVDFWKCGNDWAYGWILRICGKERKAEFETQRGENQSIPHPSVE
jgi:hypothetical protein